ncbi:MAG: hypothetical protein AAFQ14_03785 [Cyanobacteria bacterium J06621_12]
MTIVKFMDICFGDWGLGIGDWGLEIGDWGLGIGDRAYSVFLANDRFYTYLIGLARNNYFVQNNKIYVQFIDSINN